MNSEQTFRVRSDLGERDYRLYELTWLWRTAELPHDALFQDENGFWRPVRELVEPLLAEEAQRTRAREAENARKPGTEGPRPFPWEWVLVGGLFVFLLGLGLPALVQKYDAWKAADAVERQALEAERNARMDDFISSNAVVPGMVPEQVRRAIGPPRSIKATGDGAVQRWFYHKQVVVFEQGKVIGVEALPPADAKANSP